MCPQSCLKDCESNHFLLLQLLDAKWKTNLQVIYTLYVVPRIIHMSMFSTNLMFFVPFPLLHFFDIFSFSMVFFRRMPSTHYKSQIAIENNLLKILCQWYLFEVNEARTTCCACSRPLGSNLK